MTILTTVVVVIFDDHVVLALAASKSILLAEEREKMYQHARHETVGLMAASKMAGMLSTARSSRIFYVGGWPLHSAISRSWRAIWRHL